VLDRAGGRVARLKDPGIAALEAQRVDNVALQLERGLDILLRALAVDELDLVAQRNGRDPRPVAQRLPGVGDVHERVGLVDGVLHGRLDGHDGVGKPPVTVEKGRPDDKLALAAAAGPGHARLGLVHDGVEVEGVAAGAAHTDDGGFAEAVGEACDEVGGELVVKVAEEGGFDAEADKVGGDVDGRGGHGGRDGEGLRGAGGLGDGSMAEEAEEEAEEGEYRDGFHGVCGGVRFEASWRWQGW
jgi:hypothetical protein